MKTYEIPSEGEMVQLSAISTTSGTQPRQTHQETVNHYADLLSNGTKFPPVIVFNDGKKKHLASGFHRYFAHRQNGLTEIEAVIIKGTLRDAQWFAMGSNAHGRPLTAQERQTNIRRALLDAEWGQLSDRDLASHLDCSKTTILRARQALEGEGKLEKTNVVWSKDDEGKIVKTKVKKDETPKKETTEETIEQEIEAVKMMPEAPLDEREQELQEAADTINQLETENQRLKDIVATAQWDASDIEKMDVEETLKDLREKIKLLEMENKSLRSSRDMYQNRNAELISLVKSLQAKLKKLGA
jgi:DNA-binding transcriptional regulator YhcF (GntR family)